MVPRHGRKPGPTPSPRAGSKPGPWSLVPLRVLVPIAGSKPGPWSLAPGPTSRPHAGSAPGPWSLAPPHGRIAPGPKQAPSSVPRRPSQISAAEDIGIRGLLDEHIHLLSDGQSALGQLTPKGVTPPQDNVREIRHAQRLLDVGMD